MPKRDAMTAVGLLILRLGLGGYMLTHGWGKVLMLAAGDFHLFGDPIGLGSELSLILVVWAEFVGAFLVVLGLATRVAAVSVVIAMGVAAFVAHGADPWTMGQAAELYLAGEAKSWASKEPALLYLIPFLALVFTGAGPIALDSLAWRRFRRPKSEA